MNKQLNFYTFKTVHLSILSINGNTTFGIFTYDRLVFKLHGFTHDPAPAPAFKRLYTSLPSLSAEGGGGANTNWLPSLIRNLKGFFLFDSIMILFQMRILTLVLNIFIIRFFSLRILGSLLSMDWLLSLRLVGVNIILFLKGNDIYVLKILLI